MSQDDKPVPTLKELEAAGRLIGGQKRLASVAIPRDVPVVVSLERRNGRNLEDYTKATRSNLIGTIGANRQWTNKPQAYKQPVKEWRTDSNQELGEAVTKITHNLGTIRYSASTSLVDTPRTGGGARILEMMENHILVQTVNGEQQPEVMPFNIAISLMG